MKLPILPSIIDFPQESPLEKSCREQTKDLKKDVQKIANSIGGEVKPMLIGEGRDYPGAVIDTKGASFTTVITNLSNNGFVNIANLNHPGYNMKTKTAMASGLWYHVVVEEPKEKLWVFQGHEGASRASDGSKPPNLVTIHCHGTDPTGWPHIMDTVNRKLWWLTLLP